MGGLQSRGGGRVEDGSRGRADVCGSIEMMERTCFEGLFNGV